MRDITDREEKCAMLKEHGCGALTVMNCKTCKFYKPKGFKHHIRREINGREYLIDPRELGLAYCKECEHVRPFAGPNTKRHLFCTIWRETRDETSYCSKGIKMELVE